MFEHPIVVVACFVVSVVVGIFVEKKFMVMIDAEYCRDKYMQMASDAVAAKIKRIEDFAMGLAWKLGVGIGVVLSIVFFVTGIFELSFESGIFLGLLFTVLKFLGPIILSVIITSIVAMIIVDEYCVNHFGKTLAFIDMVNEAAFIKRTVCNETKLPYDNANAKYGDRYLARIGDGLNSSIKKTVWSYRIVGSFLGFAAGAVIITILMFVGIIPDNVLLTVLAGLIVETVFMFVANYFAKKYCVEHFGYLSTYYQLHIDIYSIKEQLNSENGIQIKLNGYKSSSEIAYAEQTEKLREEKLKSITLKEGYQFASVPSRIFAEKKDVPGSYCCPYCYAEVSSDVSSMCANCGKSLGVEAPVVPAPKIEPLVNVESEKLTEAPAKSNPAEKKSGGRNKKIFVGVGIGAAVLVAVLAVILIVNNGSSSSANVSATSEYNQLVEKLKRLEKEVAESENVGSDEGLDEYGGLEVGSILRSDDNLRLRAKENTDSAIITTMVKHTKVKILKIGREDESEGVYSNWVLVEVLPGGKDRDGNRIPDGTAGWCFGGFLESCPED